VSISFHVSSSLKFLLDCLKVRSRQLQVFAGPLRCYLSSCFEFIQHVINMIRSHSVISRQLSNAQSIHLLSIYYDNAKWPPVIGFNPARRPLFSLFCNVCQQSIMLYLRHTFVITKRGGRLDNVKPLFFFSLIIPSFRAKNKTQTCLPCTFQGST